MSRSPGLYDVNLCFNRPETLAETSRGLYAMSAPFVGWASASSPYLEFVVDGEPVGEPRARYGGKHAYRDTRADLWKRAVRTAVEAAHHCDPVRDLALVVSMIFRLQPPKKMPKGMRADRWMPMKKPDVDNLAKAVLDALGVWPALADPLLYRDDQLVVAAPCLKVYAAGELEPGVSVACYIA